MENCLFCSIVSGKIPSKKVYEDEQSVGFLDINPRNPGHTLVIPKRHFETILDMPENETGKLFESVRRVAEMVKNATGCQGISIAQSNGQAAGQVVKHVHFHVIPRFLNEGPVGLESILPAKKLDDSSMDSIAKSIKSAQIRTKAEHTERRHKSDEIDFNF